MLSAARSLRSSVSRLQQARRWLATETSIPIDSSTEFLQEEQRKFGKLPEQPAESEEDQRKRYTEFLEKKALEKPKRPHLGVEVKPDHGLWAFFRRLEKDGKEYHETVEELVPGKTDSSGTFLQCCLL
jgi:large subunit ribosomal protein L47